MVLSIIIVSFNTQEVLKKCLSSLFTAYRKELSSHRYEVVVVDNGSFDKSSDMIRKEYSEVVLITNRDNTGFGKANNQGVKKASGEFVLFLNPDTLVKEQTLPTLIDYLKNNPQVGIATCKVLLPDGSLDDACHRGFPTPWRAFCHFSGLSRIFSGSQLFNGYHLGYTNIDKPHEIEACAGAFLLIRKSVGEMVDWFDEDYFWYGEDLDLCFRVKQNSYKVMFLPQVTIFHHKGAASGLKKHSQHLAKLDVVTKRRIHEARFEVMRTFYKKHYMSQYPKWLTSLVFWGVDVVQKMQNAKFNIKEFSQPKADRKKYF